MRFLVLFSPQLSLSPGAMFGLASFRNSIEPFLSLLISSLSPCSFSPFTFFLSWSHILQASLWFTVSLGLALNSYSSWLSLPTAEIMWLPRPTWHIHLFLGTFQLFHHHLGEFSLSLSGTELTITFIDWSFPSSNDAAAVPIPLSYLKPHTQPVSRNGAQCMHCSVLRLYPLHQHVIHLSLFIFSLFLCSPFSFYFLTLASIIFPFFLTGFFTCY